MTYEHYSKVRDYFNMNDSQVSDKTGIARSTLSDWKSGRSNPKENKLRLIAECFGIEYEIFCQPIGKFGKFNPQKRESYISNEYYLNDETRDAAQFLYDNPEYSVLFDATRKVKPEDIDFIKKMIEKMTND